MAETEKLARSWGHHEAAWLRDYLVTGVEDPRLNLQSMLTRHFLVRELFGHRFDHLMRQEYYFGAVMDWLYRTARLARDPEGREVTIYALRNGADNAEGLEIPAFVSELFRKLPWPVEGVTIPNYIEAFLSAEPTGEELPAGNTVPDTFSRIWHDLLEGLCLESAQEAGEPEEEVAGSNPAMSHRIPRKPTVLEPACGSANDYRFLARFGIASKLEYTGFDLCGKNVENAQALFPDARFEEGNVFAIAKSAKSFDFCIVHDLLEHLSPNGLEQAVAEICRVTRKGAVVGFFQMDEIGDHVVRPRDDYYWNLLSMARMKELFAGHGFAAQVMHIGRFLLEHTGWAETHNPNAYTFFLKPL